MCAYDCGFVVNFYTYIVNAYKMNVRALKLRGPCDTEIKSLIKKKFRQDEEKRTRWMLVSNCCILGYYIDRWYLRWYLH